MLFRRTLVPVIWISSMVAAAPAQTTRPTDSGAHDVPKGPELETAKPAREARLPAEKEPPRDAPADTPNKSSPDAANSTV
ncbi:MAG TPA: hypothetical protein VKP30_17155, partial [Polyangiaceae bacterium]|nr:hypothetical protein [Polyangiaceae bacterium]